MCIAPGPMYVTAISNSVEHRPYGGTAAAKMARHMGTFIGKARAPLDDLVQCHLKC